MFRREHENSSEASRFPKIVSSALDTERRSVGTIVSRRRAACRVRPRSRAGGSKTYQLPGQNRRIGNYLGMADYRRLGCRDGHREGSRSGSWRRKRRSSSKASEPGGRRLRGRSTVSARIRLNGGREAREQAERVNAAAPHVEGGLLEQWVGVVVGPSTGNQRSSPDRPSFPFARSTSQYSKVLGFRRFEHFILQPDMF